MNRLRFLRLLPLVAAAVAGLAAPAADPDAPAAARPRDPARPTVFIAGDSTAARSPDGVKQGWGEPFRDYLDPAKVNLENRARGGRSSRTFITEGRWDELLAAVKAAL